MRSSRYNIICAIHFTSISNEFPMAGESQRNPPPQSASRQQNQSGSNQCASQSKIDGKIQADSTNSQAAAASLMVPNDGSGAAATTQFLDNYSLVAEAAKRAQMAVVMRDMESVSL